jgi:hypothetical protein
VSYNGNLDHASFFAGTSEKGALRTSTLDDVVGADGADSIGLVHVDVEGFEFAVLRGAEGILRASNPLVLFEGHLRDHQQIVDTCAYLEEFGYSTFMLNEVLPGCDLDCRNFLSVPTNLVAVVQSAVEGLLVRADRAFPAAMGPALMPVRVN